MNESLNQRCLVRILKINIRCDIMSHNDMLQNVKDKSWNHLNPACSTVINAVSLCLVSVTPVAHLCAWVQSWHTFRSRRPRVGCSNTTLRASASSEPDFCHPERKCILWSFFSFQTNLLTLTDSFWAVYHDIWHLEPQGAHICFLLVSRNGLISIHCSVSVASFQFCLDNIVKKNKINHQLFRLLLSTIVFCPALYFVMLSTMDDKIEWIIYLLNSDNSLFPFWLKSDNYTRSDQ